MANNSRVAPAHLSNKLRPLETRPVPSEKGHLEKELACPGLHPGGRKSALRSPGGFNLEIPERPRASSFPLPGAPLCVSSGVALASQRATVQ